MSNDPISAKECETLFACLEGVSHAGLGVSGGADSMALMHLASRWRERADRAGVQFSVLSVDHGLREGSAREAGWVSDQARRLGFDCTILRWRPGEKSSRIQEDARAARYGLMAQHARAHGVDALVTAHHLDDQAETLLMRLGRGSGLDGLAGIPMQGHWAGVKVLRPLLDMPKSRLVATLTASGLEWLEDPSNDDTRFERVRLRRAMDALESLGLSAGALARSARRLRRAREALDRAAGEFLRMHCQLDDAGFCRISAEALAHASDDIALRALARALQGLGGGASPPRLAKLEALFAALKAGDCPAQTLAGCQLIPGARALLIMRESGRRAPCDLVLEPGQSGLWDNRYQVSLDHGCSGPVRVCALGKTGYGDVRARLGKARALPARVEESLVSFWLDERLLAVPPLGYARQAGCSAKFVNSALFS